MNGESVIHQIKRIQMPRFIIFFFLITITHLCISQDIITTIDKRIIQCKIIEVGIEKIKYKNTEIKKSPIFEILKADVRSIRYSNGYFESFNVLSDYTVEHDSSGKAVTKYYTRDPNKPLDTNNFALIYFVFNSRSSESLKFPMYFNGQYICTLKNYQRMQYKIFSEGELLIERKSKSYGEEPKALIYVENGKSYGFDIIVADPIRWSPANIFEFVPITDSQEVKYFIDNVFYGFKPFKKSDLKLQEDINNPIIR